jgi:hypothetical protein
MDIRIKQTDDQLQDNFTPTFWGLWRMIQNGKKKREDGGFCAGSMGFGGTWKFLKDMKASKTHLLKDGTPPGYDHDASMFKGFKHDLDPTMPLDKNSRKGENLSAQTWATASGIAKLAAIMAGKGSLNG